MADLGSTLSMGINFSVLGSREVDLKGVREPLAANSILKRLAEIRDSYGSIEELLRARGLMK